MSFIHRISGHLLLLLGILGSGGALGVTFIDGSVTVITAVVFLWSLFTIVVGADRIMSN